MMVMNHYIIGGRGRVIERVVYVRRVCVYMCRVMRPYVLVPVGTEKLTLSEHVGVDHYTYFFIF